MRYVDTCRFLSFSMFSFCILTSFSTNEVHFKRYIARKTGKNSQMYKCNIFILFEMKTILKYLHKTIMQSLASKTYLIIITTVNYTKVSVKVWSFLFTKLMESLHNFSIVPYQMPYNSKGSPKKAQQLIGWYMRGMPGKACL